jgi:hypothetical protein
LSAASSMTFLFVMTTDGNLLWVPIDASTNIETWSIVSHSGDSWSTISPSSSETWTEEVV